jgi:hypothetical protein
MDMTVGEKQALQALRKLTGGVKEMTAEEKKAVKESKEHEKAITKLGRESKRVFEQSKTSARRYRDQIRMLNLSKKEGILTEKQHAQAVAFTKREMQAAGNAGRRAFGPQALSMAKGMAASLGLGVGVAGSVAKITEGYQNWLAVAREISAETKKAADDIVAFAALQEGGTKAARVREAEALAVRYGVTDRGQAFNTVQALQSAAGGDFKKGLKAAETVFAASQLGVSVETGREAEVFGAGVQLPPGGAIRKAFVAGQQSAREPETLAKIGPALPFFDDKDLAFAVGAILVKTVKEGQLEVFTRRAGIGLSTVGGLQELFEKGGLGEANRLERLRYLKKQGIETPEQLKEAGVTEIRESIAISGLVRNLAEVERVRGVIARESKAGLLAGKRRGVEAELPTTRLAREVSQAEALYRSEQAFGPVAERMTGIEVEERARGIAAQRMGFRQTAFGARTFDEEGRMPGGAVIRSWIESAIRGLAIRTTPVGVIPGAATRVERALEQIGVPSAGIDELRRLPGLTEEVLQELRTMNAKNQPPVTGSIPGDMLGTEAGDR